MTEGLSSVERQQVEQWDFDTSLLLSHARRRRAPVVSVPLPVSLSASAIIRAIRNPEQVAMDLARPMPRPPAPAARRGTAFHVWVVSRYGQQSLLDPDDLPGSGDEDIINDEALEALKNAFEQSAFAGRCPVAIEEPFSLALYCIAWSQLKGVPLGDIDAGFVMVASGDLIRPANLTDLEPLAVQLGAGVARTAMDNDRDR